jgi:hypothetical protein
LFSLPRKGIDNQYGPGKDLKAGNGHSQEETNLAPPDNAHGRVPVADRKVKGNGCCDDGKRPDYYGEKDKPEGNAIIEQPMTVEVDDLAFFPPRFQTDRAEMLAVQFHVAQGAQESPAMIAGDGGLFLRMIEAARLIIHQSLSGFPRLEGAEKGGKHINLDRRAAGWAGD